MPERRTMPSRERMAENRTLPLQKVRVWWTRTLPNRERMRERLRYMDGLRPRESKGPTLEETHRPALPTRDGWRVVSRRAGKTTLYRLRGA